MSNGHGNQLGETPNGQVWSTLNNETNNDITDYNPFNKVRIHEPVLNKQIGKLFLLGGFQLINVEEMKKLKIIICQHHHKIDLERMDANMSG